MFTLPDLYLILHMNVSYVSTGIYKISYKCFYQNSVHLYIYYIRGGNQVKLVLNIKFSAYHYDKSSKQTYFNKLTFSITLLYLKVI